ncbi:MAG: Methylenetetrahydrofolate--tRNA-(uracil-5-)-methyltransferase TrmFO [Alphaproteobacteria bacterium ADurb.Bin438]|nr:MAG: Methylenetetrahydrofolate--tRNA-(uracil-5-)-methyltransferase TrmFO [Alphaproteobacteria bacterium ADurb.Bin438]
MQRYITIIGGGLAGVEVANMLLKANIPVKLKDMKPYKKSPAHKNDNFAELVCSNSLRSKDTLTSGVGILQSELNQLGSIVMKSAIKNEVPAGGALAVNRDDFANDITNELKQNPLFSFESEEIMDLPKDEGINVIATGPLTSETLTLKIKEFTGNNNLHFFDALAPIIYGDSIDYNEAWFQSRYDKGEATDYLNCALTKEEYYNFIDDLLKAEKVEFKDFEKNTPYFEGCLPVEVMAERGVETLAYGPLKPVGLSNPKTPDTRPYAVIQLRKENKEGTLFNMVGFQTKMKHKAQMEVFRKIPALKNAVFARLGGIHRNTFINSPEVLNDDFSLKGRENIHFAGQIMGCEGYIESASMGLLLGLILVAKIKGIDFKMPPQTTAIGAMYHHVRGVSKTGRFEPMNINFGLFPEIENHKIKGKNRKAFYSERAKKDFEEWVNQEVAKIF